MLVKTGLGSVSGEFKLLSLMQKVLNSRIVVNDRTGVGCRKIFDEQVHWRESFPFCTVRPLGIKNAWEEMRMFLSGSTDSKYLENQGIMFWAGNTSREFLDNRGLHHLPEGSLGTSYSYQFRNAGGTVDQVVNLIDGLKKDPFGRRHAIDLWGVSEQDGMPLLPCWYRSSWYCTPTMNGEIVLNVKLHNRSLDILFGYYQAAMQYKMFQMALCSLLGYKCGVMTTDHVDLHVYNNQVEYVEELLSRDMGNGGIVILEKNLTSIDDIIKLEHSDFEIEGYSPNRIPIKTPRPEMAI